MDWLNKKCSKCEIKSSAVSILNNDELNILEQGCSHVDFKKGDLIFKEGSPAQSITFIRDGFVKLCKKGSGGKEHVLSISKKGAYLGIQNLNSKFGLNYFSAYALTDTKVCFLELEYFNKLLKRNGQFASEVIAYIFNDEMNYFDRLLNNIQQQLPGRVAHALLYFCHEVYSENPFVLNLTKAELGSLIGTSRESVTRMLKDFQTNGLIELEKNKILILDEEKLELLKQKG